jgi:hypothetical protein
MVAKNLFLQLILKLKIQKGCKLLVQKSLVVQQLENLILKSQALYKLKE